VGLGARSGDQGEEVGSGAVYDGREKAAPSALFSPAKLAEAAAAAPRLPQRLRDPAVFRAELSALRAKVESLRLQADNRGSAAGRVRVESLFSDERESESAVIAT
jgi:hypothetical protein